MTKPVIWVRGAGELGSAVAVTLKRTGFRLFLSELSSPLAIRRTVTFSDAVFTGSGSVEGISARLTPPELLSTALDREFIPLALDHSGLDATVRPDVIVDARMLKQRLPSDPSKADVTIGLGPGFIAGENCTVVIETNRGHNLGKIITDGAPEPDTGTPGTIGGQSRNRVIYAPASGALTWDVDFGTIVAEGERLGAISSVPVQSRIGGIVRGLISPRVPIAEGLKIADIDPRGSTVDYRGISDKARSVARAVLEAVIILSRERTA